MDGAAGLWVTESQVSEPDTETRDRGQPGAPGNDEKFLIIAFCIRLLNCICPVQVAPGEISMNVMNVSPVSALPSSMQASTAGNPSAASTTHHRHHGGGSDTASLSASSTTGTSSGASSGPSDAANQYVSMLMQLSQSAAATTSAPTTT